LAAGPEASSVAAFSDARARVLEAVSRACGRVGRDSSEVTLVAVSKTVSLERLRAAVEAGLTTLGENRVQEAEAKVAGLPGVRWHLVGHLQSNKARRAIELFEVIESVDSFELAARLDRLAGELARAPLRVYLQANVDRDEAKAGFTPEGLAAGLPALAALANLRLEGLMTVGLLMGSAEEARPTFVRLRELSERLRGQPGGESLGGGLSMGMTDDFEVAVEEGATVIRVGRALFGER
jgi:pyridoxal phosphate enzyme (YggS family)